MKPKIINQKEALDLLKSGKDISSYELQFNDSKVEALDVLVLSRNGYSVPDELIWYDDNTINFEDAPEATYEQLEKGKRLNNLSITFSVKPEIKEWLDSNDINTSELMQKLITNFYEQLDLVDTQL